MRHAEEAGAPGDPSTGSESVRRIEEAGDPLVEGESIRRVEEAGDPLVEAIR
jgi:hypothetical protein